MRLFAVTWAFIVAFATPVAAQGLNGLVSFASETELRGHLAEQAAQEPECPPDWEVCPGYDDLELGSIVITGSRIQATPITNVQEVGVDEGDIVKMWGDILIILRRGRLFTVDTAGGSLRPVDWIDAFPRGASPDDYDWLDEMLVVDGWVVVIGYSYDGDGTDIIRFRLNASGHLTYADSHRLSSDDYYSSRNYASRLIGDRLIVYSPQYVRGADPMASLPTLSRLDRGAVVATRPIVRAQDVYLDAEAGARSGTAIHTVTSCDLTAPSLDCSATAVLGPEGRTFYVSSDAVYLWLTDYVLQETGSELAQSSLYRLPHDGTPPLAVAVRGAPIDQFSFEEDLAAGLLHVLVVSEGGGDAMWAPEFAEDASALLTLPISRFAEGRHSVRDEDYRFFPPSPDNAYRLHNRFVGDYLLFAASTSSWDYGGLTLLTIAPLDGRREIRMMLHGATERIEQMGRDALLVTRGADATFRTIALAPDGGSSARSFSPRVTDTYVLPDFRGAESRSHAFFYQPDPASPDGEQGILGLPVIRQYEQPDLEFDRAADMAFLRRGNDRLRLMGLLESRPELERDDRCVVSCVDWYGDARPIFIGDRIFALLGYELVEGRPEGRTIREIQRASFAPRLSDR